MKYTLFPVLAFVFGLSACADTAWHQAGKNQRDMGNDLDACERKVEAATLAESGTSRGDYGMATRGPNATLDPRGLSPLQLKDKSDLASRYDDGVFRCMRAKGYMQGHPADQRR